METATTEAPPAQSAGPWAISVSKSLWVNGESAHSERSSSVVESLTRDRVAVGYSLIGITVLCP